MSEPAGPGRPSSSGDVPWASGPEGEPPEQHERPAATAWRRADQLLSPGRLRLLALVSVLTTGLVIWAGTSTSDSSGLAAALVRRTVEIASASAPAATTSSSTAASPSVPPISAPQSTPDPAPVSSATAGAAAASSSSATSTSSTATTSTTSSAAAADGTAKSGTTGATGATGASAVQRKIKHVFVIVLASPGYTQTWGPGSPASYLTTQLRPQGTLLSDYYAVAHPDLPDYIAMVSGQPPNPDTDEDCPTFTGFPTTASLNASGILAGSGCVYPSSVLTVGDQVTSSGRVWKGYIEDLSSGTPPVTACRHPNSNAADPEQDAVPGDQYATQHNPFVYFHSLLDYGDCQADDLPLTQLTTDLASAATTPSYAFIVPNLCDDGTDSPCVDGRPGGLTSADAFLTQWVPLIEHSPAYASSMLVITFDDAPASDTSGCCTTPATGGGRIGTLVLSPFTKAGATSTAPYDDYSLLRTVEDLFGFAHLGDAALPSVHSFGTDVLQGVFPSARKK